MNYLLWFIMCFVFYNGVIVYPSSWILSSSVYETISYNTLLGNRAQRTNRISKYTSYVDTSVNAKSPSIRSAGKMTPSAYKTNRKRVPERNRVSKHSSHGNTTKVAPPPPPPIVFNCSYCLPKFGKGEKNIYDYASIEYPIPFHELYSDYTTHYVNYNKRIPHFPRFVHFGDVGDDAFMDSDYVTITGCSQNHLLSTINLLYSIVYTDKSVSIVFVDYGLTKEGIDTLIKEFSNIHQLHLNLNSNAQIYYRKFNFKHFPSWYDITNPDHHGGYSWKVISYFDVLNQTRRIINWTDGGALWTGSIKEDKKRVYEHGIFTPYSGGAIQSYVHYFTRSFLEKHKMVRKIFLGKGMCTGGYIWLDYKNATIMEKVVLPLLQCAYTRQCISPFHSNRKNHRQDQAVLSAMVHSASLKNSCNGAVNTKVAFHQDCKSESKCKEVKDLYQRKILARSRIPTRQL